ncbi:MAG TPA: glycoside hydrolase 100 family protein [Ktedonobacteraceae bacterium]|nr:glycoside hydrolase 100 family protein [Ktedonobacteraceae bacterium]
MDEAQAYQRSLEMLRRCLSPAGFLASPDDNDKYARIWTRDGMITGLAALASGEADLVVGMHRTLLTLGQYQGPHGEIPSNVSVDGKQVSYGKLVGRVDALFWYVIGVCAYCRLTNDSRFKKAVRPNVERALFLAGCWEFNNRGFLYTPLSGNWADEYIQQGYVLSDQLLYQLALYGAGTLFAKDEWLAKAVSLKQLLALNYWPKAILQHDPLIYHPHAYQATVEQMQESIVHWLPAFSPAGYHHYFDGLAHALALLDDLGDGEQRQRSEAYVQALESEVGNPLLPAFWPVIQLGTPEWHMLELNHLYGEIKNQPYMYHNGGLWPVLSGLYAVGLARHRMQHRAEHLLHAINEANALGSAGEQWEFAEYHHTLTYQPLGTKYMAWSAAAGILAHQALRKMNIPLLLPS